MAAIALLVFFSNAMFPPLLPALAREFSVHPFDLKWLVPGFSFVYGSATLVYGIVSDRWGRTLILKLLLLFAAVELFVLSFAATVNQLIVFRVLSGLGTGGIVTIALSIIGDRYPYPVQGRPMGRMFGAMAAGMGLGASVGPLLSTLIGWRLTLRLVAAGFIIAAIWVHRCYREVLIEDRCLPVVSWIVNEYRCILRASRGSHALIFILANAVFHGGIFAWLGVLLAARYRLGDAAIGVALLGYGVPALFLGKLIGGWADRFGRRYVVPAGFFWAAASAALLAVTATRWMAALMVAALSIGFDATHPLMSSITTSLDPKHRGQVTGMTTFANFLGMGIGALAFRNLLHFGFPRALVAFAVFEGVSGAAAIYCFQQEIPEARL
jgi:predicted MFS family arabinose efflux permease